MSNIQQMQPVDTSGSYSYPNMVRKPFFFRADERTTEVVTVAQGQVLKPLTFLESLADGRMVAHGSMVSSIELSLTNTLAATYAVDTITLHVTASGAGVTAETIAQAFTALFPTAQVSDLTAINANPLVVAIGNFTSANTSGSIWSVAPYTISVSANTITFDCAVTSGGAIVASTYALSTSITVARVVNATGNKISGLVAKDFVVDARASDVQVSAYTEVSLYAAVINWKQDPLVDTILDANNIPVPCTYYDTGTQGNPLLMKKFVEQTNFSPLGFLAIGEVF